jgi:two-component system response regulator RegX3
MTQILLIEDDPLITGPVLRALEAAGYEATSASDGKTGIEMALQQHPDLVLLDIMLPKMSGWDVCKELRTRSTVPIVMLTALNEEIDRILGLELGADDYITKPFSTRELLARIKAALRRVELDTQHQAGSRRLSILDITMDIDTRRVYKNGQELQLRYKEFELLSLLMSSAGQVVTRAEIFDKVWGTEWLGDMRTLDVHIRWLREKLEDDPGQPILIQTVRGIGYRFATA